MFKRIQECPFKPKLNYIRCTVKNIIPSALVRVDPGTSPLMIAGTPLNFSRLTAESHQVGLVVLPIIKIMQDVGCVDNEFLIPSPWSLTWTMQWLLCELSPNLICTLSWLFYSKAWASLGHSWDKSNFIIFIASINWSILFCFTTCSSTAPNTIQLRQLRLIYSFTLLRLSLSGDKVRHNG